MSQPLMANVIGQDMRNQWNKYTVYKMSNTVESWPPPYYKNN